MNSFLMLAAEATAETAPVAEKAAEVAFDLEKKGKEEDLDGVQADIESLADQIVEVDKMLRGIIKQQSN